MRGRTNIAQADGIMVNGDVITATAVENIGRGDFVNYEVDAQVKSFASTHKMPIHYLRLTPCKIRNNVLYRHVNSTIEVYKHESGLFNLKSVFSGFKVESFCIIDDNHILCLGGKKLVVLSETNGVLTQVSELGLDVTGKVFLLDSTHAVVLSNGYSTSGSTKYYGIISVLIDVSDLNNLSELSRTEKIDYDKTSQSQYHFDIIQSGNIFFIKYYFGSSSSDATSFEGKFAKIVYDEENVVSLNYISTLLSGFSSTNYYGCIFGISRWFIGFDYYSYISSSSAIHSVVKIIDTNTGGVKTQDLYSIGVGNDFGDVGSNTVYHYFTLSLINGSKFLAIVKDIYFTSRDFKSMTKGMILNFNIESGLFELDSNILDFGNIMNDSYDAFYNCSVVNCDVPIVFFERNRPTENKVYYTEFENNSGSLFLPSDKNKVSKYKGGIAIGFAKASAKADNEIQIYVPKT